MKTIVCPNCGAEFDAMLPECPYCEFINQEGAENKFFEDLQETREHLVELVDAPEAGGAYKDEIKTSSSNIVKKVVIIGLVVLALVAIGVIADRIMFDSGSKDKDYAEELAWQNEHFVELDELYNDGDYDELIDLIEKYEDEDHEMWNWAHYYFATTLREYDYIEEYIEVLNKGELSKSDAELLTYSVFIFCYKDYQWNVKDENDLAKLDELAEKVRGIAHERLGFSDSMISKFKKKVYPDKYVVWRESKKIADKYYENYK